MATTRTYSDIDLSFEPHPITKDLQSKTNDAAIKNAVKNLILTQHYERLFHSEIGSSVNGLLFDLPSPGMISLLKTEINNVITNFEPRVDVLSIKVKFSPDSYELFVTITFKIKNTTRPITVQFVLNRTR